MARFEDIRNYYLSPEASYPDLTNLAECPEGCGPWRVDETREDVSADHGLPPESVWDVHMRCANCQDERTELCSDRRLEAHDEHHYRAGDALIKNLKKRTKENMEYEADQFTKALEAGAILPEDF